MLFLSLIVSFFSPIMLFLLLSSLLPLIKPHSQNSCPPAKLHSCYLCPQCFCSLIKSHLTLWFGLSPIVYWSSPSLSSPSSQVLPLLSLPSGQVLFWLPLPSLSSFSTPGHLHHKDVLLPGLPYPLGLFSVLIW